MSDTDLDQADLRVTQTLTRLTCECDPDFDQADPRHRPVSMTQTPTRLDTNLRCRPSEADRQLTCDADLAAALLDQVVDLPLIHGAVDAALHRLHQHLGETGGAQARRQRSHLAHAQVVAAEAARVGVDAHCPGRSIYSQRLSLHLTEMVTGKCLNSLPFSYGKK